MSSACARTLREFVAILEAHPIGSLKAYLHRGDFSRWIADVFGDRALAEEIRAQEDRYVAGTGGDTIGGIVGAIRGRYDLTDNKEELRGGVTAARAA